VMVSMEQNPKLLQATRQSLLNAVMGAALLRLPVDGVTGQAYIVPFKERGAMKAQLIVGYGGLITLAARSGWIVTATDDREKDELSLRGGTEPMLSHTFDPKRADRGPVRGAYAVARHRHFPPVYRYLDLATIYEARDRSSGWRAFKAGHVSSSPWQTDPLAMILKTPIRQLAKVLPRDVQMGVALEDQHDLGRVAYVTPDGIRMDGEGPPPVDPVSRILPRLFAYTADGIEIACRGTEDWMTAVYGELEHAATHEALEAFWAHNFSAWREVTAIAPAEAQAFKAAVDLKIEATAREEGTTS